LSNYFGHLLFFSFINDHFVMVHIEQSVGCVSPSYVVCPDNNF